MTPLPTMAGMGLAVAACAAGAGVGLGLGLAFWWLARRARGEAADGETACVPPSCPARLKDPELSDAEIDALPAEPPPITVRRRHKPPERRLSV